MDKFWRWLKAVISILTIYPALESLQKRVKVIEEQNRMLHKMYLYLLIKSNRQMRRRWAREAKLPQSLAWFEREYKELEDEEIKKERQL
jgi:hypothetical protein